MSQVISDGWLNSKLEDVVDTIVGGGTPSKAISSYFQGDIPWMSVKDMNKNELVDTVDHISQEAVENSSTNVIPAGTPIVATRMSLGKIVTASFDSAINQDLKALFLNTNVEKKYFVYWYRSIANLIESLGTGTTVKGIRLEILKGLEFPLPPLAEQKVIADKLDELLAQVESTKARLDAIPALLKSFRQSVLAAAVSGKLTEEWCGTEVKDWHSQVLKDLCTSISDGDHQAPPKADKGVPFLVISNVNNGEVNFDKVSRWVPDTYYDSLKDIRKPQLNDILYTVTGSLGIPVIVKTNKPFCFQRHIAILRPDHSKVNYQYLDLALKAPDTFEHATNVATGTAQKTVSLTSLRKFNFSMPPLDEQAEIVRRVEELFTFADKVEAQVNEAQARVNNLTQSILAKAFRGELTADWRAANPELILGENSAEALLKRIKSERESLALAAKATKKKPAKKTSAKTVKE